MYISGLVVPIGLVARDAILIMEFVKVRVEQGRITTETAIEAAKVQL